MESSKIYTKDLVKVANAMIRPNIWQVSHTVDPVDGTEKRFYQYGNCRVIVQGQLYEKDFATWLCMLAISEGNGFQIFESDNLPVEIAKQMNVRNPFNENSLRPIRDSIDRLLDSQIRIRPDKGQGLSAKFVLIQGWLGSDGCQGSFCVTPYRDIVQKLMFGQTYISKTKYLSIKSLIAKALYKLLISQQLFYSGNPYSINLSSLCEYLNYDVQDRPWRIVWRDSIKNAVEELIQKGFIGRYIYEKNRRKDIGGILTFFPVKKASKPPTTGETNSEYLETIRNVFGDKIMWNEISEQKYRTVLNKAEAFLTENYESGLKDFLKDYCQWLDRRNKIQFIDPSLFNPDNSFFQQYLKIAVADRSMLLKEKPSWVRPKPEQKILSPVEQAMQHRRRKERDERERKLDIECSKQKCPFEDSNTMYGKSFGMGECDDERCPFKEPCKELTYS